MSRSSRAAQWLCFLMAGCVLSLFGCNGSSTTAGPPSPLRTVTSACDDSIAAAAPHATVPPGAVQAGLSATDVYIGSRGIWFAAGPQEHSWGQVVQRVRDGYDFKVAISTLDSFLPEVTVSRIDAERGGMGNADLRPTSAGLPGWVPTLFHLSTPGCWAVSAVGSKGRVDIRVRVVDRHSP